MQGLWAQIRTFPQPSLLERPVVSLDAPSLFQQTAQRTLRQRHHHDSVSTLDLVHPRCRSIRGRARGNTRCWLGFILLVAVGHRAIPLSKVSEVQDRAEGLEDELSRVLYFNLLPPVLAQSASCPSISFDSGEQEHEALADDKCLPGSVVVQVVDVPSVLAAVSTRISTAESASFRSPRDKDEPIWYEEDRDVVLVVLALVRDQNSLVRRLRKPVAARNLGRAFVSQHSQNRHRSSATSKPWFGGFEAGKEAVCNCSNLWVPQHAVCVVVGIPTELVCEHRMKTGPPMSHQSIRMRSRGNVWSRAHDEWTSGRCQAIPGCSDETSQPPRDDQREPSTPCKVILMRINMLGTYR
eukprot:1859804-Rhodomonas_salina.2